MPDASSTHTEVGLSTTLLMALAALGAALLPIFGEDDGFRAVTVAGGLVGLLPWALVLGGVRVGPWPFALLAIPPGALVVLVGDNSGGMFPLLLAMVWLARSSRSALPPAAVALAAMGAITALTIEKGSADETGIVYFAGGLGISWLCGVLLRRQEDLTAQLEALRDAQVEQLAATERARIAREVHDVVAHSLTVVMLNLTGARRALAVAPERADEALARAEVVGRDSLDSIRQVMGLLRDPSAGAALPQPTIDGIPRLVEGYRHAGLDVALRVTTTVAVDPTVELVAYRVVQESLANVLQHAPGAAADVTLDDDGGGLAVTISNGAATATVPSRPARTGLGTRGMGERVRAVGGTLQAAATCAGGWTVTAWLPARSDAPAPAPHV